MATVRAARRRSVGIERYATDAARRCALRAPQRPAFNRIAYAAAHVVADPLADNDPWLTPAIDWDATHRATAQYLWDLGLGVAEAMDTAQRGMGLGWPEAQELIRAGSQARSARPRER